MGTRHALAIAVILVVGSNTFAEPPLLVGTHGDLEHVELRGNETFTSEAIRQSLASQIEVLPATRELASFSKLLELLRDLVERGYRAGGFADVSVETSFDEQASRIVITIKEGPRYREGDVHVSGVEGELQELLLEAVLVGMPPEDAVLVPNGSEDGKVVGEWRDEKGKPIRLKPVWRGKPHAQLGEWRRQWIEQGLKRTLERHGNIDPDLEVRYVTVKDDAVHLHIDVHDPGRPIQITEVTIDGAQRNSRESILELIDIRPGDQWNLSSELLAEYRLQQCGRFYYGDLTLIRSVQEPSSGTVHVHLRECDLVPPLSEPLSGTDEALLRCAEWLENLPHGDLDLVIDLNLEVDWGSVSSRIVTSFASGILMDFDISKTDGRNYRYVIVIDSEHWSLLSTRTHQKYEIEFTESFPIMTNRFSFRGLKNADSDGRQVRIGYGVSVSSSDKPVEPAEFSVEPVVFLYSSRHDDVDCKRADGVLTFRGKTDVVQINEQTGRLISLQSTSLKNIHFLRVVTEKNAYERMKAKLNAEDRAYANIADPQRPVMSAVEFLLNEFQVIAQDSGKEELAKRAGLWNGVLETHLGPRIDAILRHRAESKKVERFKVPPAKSPRQSILSAYASWFLKANSFLFARQATPAVLSRELAAAIVVKDKTAMKNISRIAQSVWTGPLTHWYAAELLRFIHPKLRRAFATAGLARLRTRHLRNDLRELLKEPGFLGTALRDVTSALHEMSAEECKLLFGFIKDSQQRRSLVNAARDADSTGDEAVITICEMLWEAGIKDVLKRRLQQLARPPSRQATAAIPTN